MNHENTDKLSLDTVFTMSPGGCYENCFLVTFHELAHGLIKDIFKKAGGITLAAVLTATLVVTGFFLSKLEAGLSAMVRECYLGW